MRKWILFSFFSQALGFLFHYATLFILVRLISVEEFGIFQKYNLFLTTVLPFIGFTLVSSLYYFYAQGDVEYRKQLVIQTYLLLAIAGFIFFVGIFFAKDYILGWLQLRALSFVPTWVYLTLPLYLVATMSDNIFLLDKKQTILLIYLPAEKLLYLLVIFCLYYFNRTIESVLYGILIYSLGKFAFVSGYVYRMHYFSKFRFQRWLFIEQTKYCIPFYVANIAYILSVKFDKIFLNKFITTEEFAIYSISFLSIPLLANAFNSINNVAMTEISTLLNLGQKEEVKKLYRNVVTKTSSIAIPFVLFFFINGKEVISFIFTEKYIESLLYYRIYLLTFFVSLTSYGLILRASNKTNVIFRINGISAILVVLIGYFLIQQYKMTGAIITAVLAMWLPGFLQLFTEMKYLKAGFFEFFPIKKILMITGSAIFASPVIFLIRHAHFQNFWHLFVSFISYVLILVPLLNYFKLLPFQDKLNKLNFLKSKEFRR